MKIIKRVLLVEDDRDDQSLFCESLTELHPGFICEMANDGPHALEMIAQNTFYDYIFIDLNLPKMDGFQVLETIKQTTLVQNVPLIVLSSTKRQSDIDRCYELGATSFFSKPSSFTELVDVMREAFGEPLAPQEVFH